jgi:ribonuclease R
MNKPAPAGAFVGVLSTRGRFLIAEPLFEPRRERSSSQRGRARPVVVASGRDPVGRSARPGDLVLLSRPKSSGARAGSSSVRVVRVLGRPDVARDMIEALMLDRGLRRGFDPAVQREARHASELALDTNGRRDFRDLATFTIDPVSARDFDDAISAERLEDGAIRVWVHIADVSAYVPEASPLDREARRRATSVYVPGAVEPMLPEALSTGACSLMPGVGRLAVTVEMDLAGATVQRVAFHRSIIRSDARLTYEEVDGIFAGREPAGEPWGQPLGLAREVAGALEDARRRRGGLTLDSIEPQFIFDSDGNVSDIEARAQTESHRVIEHLMIAANEAVAGFLQKRKAPCLYRVHERPDPERIRRLVEQLETLDVPTPPLPDRMSGSQAAEILGEISQLIERHVARALARTGASSPGRSPSGGRLALTSLVLRSLKQAYYSPENIGHAGLSSTTYCHFTSPIRRYPDLVCHRALLHAIGAGEEPGDRRDGLGQLGEWASEREREAMLIERDADDMARCFALERMLYRDGWQRQFSGEITGLISAGAFVAFGEDTPTSAERAMPVYEGMLPVRRMTAGGQATADLSGATRGSRDARSNRHPPRGASPRSEREWWELGEQGTILHASRSGATLKLGDPVQVRVVGVDTARGRVDLALPSS